MKNSTGSLIWLIKSDFGLLNHIPLVIYGLTDRKGG
nr:hypothetical protein YKEOBPQY_YKEOBPQY_CDS_0011 [Microvirus sp.]